MNSNIKQLMLSAGFVAPELATRASKLADLIVEETVRLLEQKYRDSIPKGFVEEFDSGYQAGLYTAEQAIKQHFGVEQ